jgi:hypothetical protein
MHLKDVRYAVLWTGIIGARMVILSALMKALTDIWLSQNAGNVFIG